MRQLMMGILLGSLLTAGASYAGHYFGHDPNAGAMQNWERLQQQQERFNQEQFRIEQRLRPPC